MADKMNKKLLENDLFALSGLPDYQRAHARCTEGTESKYIDAQRAKNIAISDVGELCLAVLEHGANVEFNAAAKAKRPDKQLLGYYKYLAADKGYANSDGRVDDVTAEKVLRLYATVGKQPNARAAVFNTAPVPNSAQEKEWVFNPGNAFHAAFTDTVLRALKKNEPIAPPAMSSEAIINAANACFKDVAYHVKNKVTMGPCTDAGEAAGAMYVAQKKQVMAR